MKIGKKMLTGEMLVAQGGRRTLIDIAKHVGPNGSLKYGYEIVGRAIRAGLVERLSPLPGRRGASLGIAGYSVFVPMLAAMTPGQRAVLADVGMEAAS